MSQVNKILLQLKETHEAEILNKIQEAYERISNEQAVWYEKTKFFCPEACGECCRNFEPDLLEGEALFMAAWLIENQPEVAEKVANGEFPFPQNKGCRFWNEKADYHCTIYGARPFICRLFGGCGNRGKSGEVVFKPCKFYSNEKLKLYKPPFSNSALEHRQYSQKEVEEIFGILPPVMSDIMESVVSVVPENHETKLIQEILPETIKRLQWILSMCANS